MINYELAKALKDAGFPQQESAGIQFFNGYVGYGLGYLDGDGIYYPTLSELIEACGEDFNGILRSNNEWEAGESWKWENFDDEKCIARGSTPEEAVALFWLELNKKNE